MIDPPWIVVALVAAVVLGLFARRLIDTLQTLVRGQRETNRLLAVLTTPVHETEVALNLDRVSLEEAVAEAKRRQAWR